MRKVDLDALMDRYQADEAFRDRLRQDPVATLAAASLDLPRATAARPAAAMSRAPELGTRLSRKEC